MTDEVQAPEAQPAQEEPKPQPRKAPAKPKFDPKADYAEVRGQGIKARFLQGGEYFGAQGEPLGKKLV